MMQLVDEWRVTVTWTGQSGRELDFYLAGNSLANVIKAAGDVRFKPEPDQIKIERFKHNEEAQTGVSLGWGGTITGPLVSSQYKFNECSSASGGLN